MAQKLVNFGQKIATATPRLVTRISFLALGKKLKYFFAILVIFVLLDLFFSTFLCLCNLVTKRPAIGGLIFDLLLKLCGEYYSKKSVVIVFTVT